MKRTINVLGLNIIQYILSLSSQKARTLQFL